MEKGKKEFVRIKELAKVLNVSTRTIERWRKLGLPFIKIGNVVTYDVEKVSAWLNDNHTVEKSV